MPVEPVITNDATAAAATPVSPSKPRVKKTIRHVGVQVIPSMLVGDADDFSEWDVVDDDAAYEIVSGVTADDINRINRVYTC